jgi:hypothetical protein
MKDTSFANCWRIIFRNTGRGNGIHIHAAAPGLRMLLGNGVWFGCAGRDINGLRYLLLSSLWVTELDFRFAHTSFTTFIMPMSPKIFRPIFVMFDSQWHDGAALCY